MHTSVRYAIYIEIEEIFGNEFIACARPHSIRQNNNSILSRGGRFTFHPVTKLNFGLYETLDSRVYRVFIVWVLHSKYGFRDNWIRIFNILQPPAVATEEKKYGMSRRRCLSLTVWSSTYPPNRFPLNKIEWNNKFTVYTVRLCAILETRCDIVLPVECQICFAHSKL